MQTYQHQLLISNEPLPVELSSFSALVNVNNVNLRWKTATLVNNNGLEVQREARSQVRSRKSEIMIQSMGEDSICTGARKQ